MFMYGQRCRAGPVYGYGEENSMKYSTCAAGPNLAPNRHGAGGTASGRALAFAFALHENVPSLKYWGISGFRFIWLDLARG